MRDYSSEVNTVFVAWHGDGRNLTSAERLNERYAVAKAMLSGKYSGIVNELKRRAKAHHTAEMNEWGMVLDNVSLADNVGQYVITPLI